MARLTASLCFFSGILLSACSSQTEVLYEAVDNTVVIESETWSAKLNSLQHTWLAQTSGDIVQHAKLGKLLPADEKTTNANRDPTAEYQIKFTDTGIHYLWIRAKVLNGSVNPTLTVSVKTAGIAQQISDFSNEWRWTSVDANQNILSVNIASADLHRLSITTDSTDLLFDKMILTSLPGFVPTGAGPDATLVDSDNPQTPTAEGAEPEAADSPIIVDDSSDSQEQADNVNTKPQVTILHAGDADTNPVVNVGQELQLVADATDDGLPTATLYTYWTKVAGPGDVEFNDRTSADPLVRFSTPGSYTLQVSANDTELYSNALVTVEVEASPTVDAPQDNSLTEQDNILAEQDNVPVGNEQPPVVSISGNTSAETAQTHELTAIITNSSDDPVYYYWNLIDGNGTAIFSDIQSQTTAVSFDQPGQYIVQVNASNDNGYTNATIEINVTANDSGNSTTNNQSPADDQTNLTSPPNFSNIGSARWHNASASGSPAKRHETSGVAVDGKIYVIGGRGHQPIDVYDSASNSWSQAAKPPLEMHHFQAVAIDRIIYVVGAATCCFPVETNLSNVYQFDTRSGNWSKGAAIPTNRLRGSTAAAVYNKKIYIVGGNTRGHSGGAVNWFDEFDPATGQWKRLADAPDARDHATIAVVGDQLVVAGGRRSDHPNTFGNTVGRTNIYNFKTQQWQTAANIPTQRAGTMAVGIGSELVVIGGESLASNNAHNTVEAFDIFNGTWRSLSPLPTPRHGGAAAIINNHIHVVAGSKQLGGAPETDAHEILK